MCLEANNSRQMMQMRDDEHQAAIQINQLALVPHRLDRRQRRQTLLHSLNRRPNRHRSTMSTTIAA